MPVKLTNRETSLWAKKRVADGEMLWLPLVVHLNDCEQTINWLFDHWLDPGQQRILTESISVKNIQKLIKFLGFFHDIGKATPAFQTKKSFDNSASLDEELIERLNRNGFFELRMSELSSPQKSPHALAGEAILEGEFKVPESVGAIIGGHHGIPTKNSPKSQLKNYTRNYDQVEGHVQDPAIEKRHQEEKQAWQNTRQRLFDYGMELAGYTDVSEIPDVGQPQAVILEGLLIMADWLSSSENLELKDGQTKPMFTLIDIDQNYQDIDMTSRFESAILTWKQTNKWLPKKVTLNDDTNPYLEHWGYTPRPVQLAMTQEIQKTVDPGLVIVEAGMGIGKTEIALVAAEQMAYKTGRDGFFMGLPTQATTNAMFTRVLEWTQDLADSEGKKLAINLLQGKREYNSTFTSLPEASNIYDQDEDKQPNQAGSVVVNSWFNGKKSILTDFTIGTVDNILLMALKKKHLFLRHLGFSGKVVVVDEVHAYDTYMSSYLFKAMNWLGAYHVPVIILSATLPIEKRNQLVESYLRGKYGRGFQKQLVAKDGWEKTRAYPLLTVLDGPKLKQLTEFDHESQKSTKLHIQRLNVDDEELALEVKQKIKQGGVAGIIVNTVKRAQTLAKVFQEDPTIKADTYLMVLHSAFLAPERSAQEEALQKCIGKNGQRPHKMIVIGTQVLEQSLDIDFDVLYTDIAPIDLILQRAGRLHRHMIQRPQSLKVPELFVMGIEAPYEYGDANEAIYEKYLLMKSNYFLPDTVTLPDDISELVQKVYDAKTDALIPEIVAAKTKFDKDQAQEKQRSRVFQIGLPKSKTIHGWLDCEFRNLGKDEQSSNAAVRDIQETIEVILVQCTAKKRCLVNGTLLKDVSDQEISEQVVRLPLAITPNAAVITKVIDELEDRTRESFSDWQESPWLRGALALPLDGDLSAVLGNWRLTYSKDLGLSYTKEGDLSGESEF